MISFSTSDGSRVLDGKRILLIISGGIAAYKSLELIRRLRERGAAGRCILTAAAQNFVTPPPVSAASGAFFPAGDQRKGPRLEGRRALVTSGPTYEPIARVRYIATRSSGKQGHAIAAALAGLGAETVLISGPSREADPRGVRVVHV